MLRIKILVLLLGLFLVASFATEASASPIVSAIDWLGNSTIGWLKLVTTVNTGTGGYNYDYIYDLSFAKDATHTKYYYEGSSEYARAFKVLDPLRLPVYAMTTPTGWTFDNSSPDYFKWESDFANRLTVASGGKTFAVHSNYRPGRSHASAWDGGTAAEGGTYTPVPEPTSMLLFGMGILGLFGLKRKS